MKYLLDNIECIKGWSCVVDRSVGCFEAMGFSNQHTNQLICISSHYTSMIDCDLATVTKVECEYDERSHLALCDALPGEMVSLCSAWRGTQKLESGAGESVQIYTTDEMHTGKSVVRYRVQFCTGGDSIEIFNSYGYYTCTFSPCGNYFALIQDGGLTILKRDSVGEPMESVCVDAVGEHESTQPSALKKKWLQFRKWCSKLLY